MGWNMILRLFAVLLLFCPITGMAATITATTGGGNWSTTSTWVGGVLPDPLTDTVIIPSTLTAPVVLDDSRTIPATTVEDEVYGLVQSAGVVTTLVGPLTIGNGTSKDGKFTFGAGAELAQGANNVILGNCIITSDATTGSWAKVTGSGNWQTHGTVTSPKQDFSPRYVSWQNTGSILIAIKATTGMVTERLDVQHCVFAGQTALTFGTSSTTLNFTRNFLNNDVVEVPDVFFTGPVGTPTTPLNIAGTTFRSSSTLRNIRVDNLSGTLFKGAFFYNYQHNVTSAGNAPIDDTENFWAQTVGGSGQGMISLRIGNNHNVYRNYFHTSSSNVHLLTQSGTPNGSTHNIEGNVWESVYNTNEGDFIEAAYGAAGGTTRNVHHNLLIGNVVLSYSTNTTNVASVHNEYNNTVYKTSQEDSLYGSLWYNEVNGPWPGTLNITNNLVALKSTLTPTSNDKLLHTFGGFNQTVAKLGWTGYWNITSPYDDTYTVTNDQTANDKNVNPGFVDTTRNLATWGQIYLGSDGSTADAIAKILAVNGYNATTKTQSDAQSGASIYGTSTSLVNWVRAGFVPTNVALKTAGEGGTYIGAIDPVTAASNFPAALLMVQ